MGNPFKKVIHNEKLPDLIKKKVLDDINVIKLALDVADLIVIKFPETIGDILKKNDNKKEY
ncbi:hypothetical protein ACJOV8_014945 [Formosa sp. 3Alg 14/1]|uniref:hypothetical protein n=1 Tax=unclassified Formosa TaxID=2644710 RepID=UPI0039BE240D